MSDVAEKSIVAVHGFLGLPSDWNSIFPDAKAPSLWSFLEKTEQTQDSCMPKMGEALNQYTLQTQNEPSFLVAYSFGGRVAMHAILSALDTPRPDGSPLYKGVVLVSAHPGLSEFDRKTRFAADQKWAAQWMQTPWEKILLAWNQQPTLAASKPCVRGEKEISRRLLHRALSEGSVAMQEDLLPQLQKISTPCLLVSGEKDQKYCDLYRNISRVWRSSRHCVIPKAGHRVPWDEPSVFRERVFEFISSL